MSRTMAEPTADAGACREGFWGDDIDDCCSVRWLEVDQAIGYTPPTTKITTGRIGSAYGILSTTTATRCGAFAVRKLAVSWEYMPGHVLVEDTESDHHVVEQIIDGDRASALRRAATACMAEIGIAMPATDHADLSRRLALALGWPEHLLHSAPEPIYGWRVGMVRS